MNGIVVLPLVGVRTLLDRFAGKVHRAYLLSMIDMPISTNNVRAMLARSMGCPSNVADAY
jgi:hypothetical protein